MKPKYTVAFIGCGKRAMQHVPAVKADARGRVVAVADVKREAAEALNAAGQFGATVYTDHRPLLERERPDFVITCLWTALHLPVFQDCVAAGVKAVLSEKPMAPTWGETVAMAQLAEKSGCQLMFCHQRRFAAGNQLARQLLREGRFGQLLRLDLYSPPHLLDCGTHTFDQALSFNNETPAKWVHAAVDTSKLIKFFNVPAECMATGQIVFQNGVRAQFQVGGPDLDLGSGVRAHGTEGFFEVSWDGQWKRAVVYRDPTWQPPAVADAHEQDCLETGREPELSWRKALRAAEIIFAAYESVRRRARVELPVTITDEPVPAILGNR
jgi:UDP-N-acetyl-2-amino-2-deoxyglucuronate dehydrogenase